MTKVFEVFEEGMEGWWEEVRGRVCAACPCLSNCQGIFLWMVEVSGEGRGRMGGKVGGKGDVAPEYV